MTEIKTKVHFLSRIKKEFSFTFFLLWIFYTFLYKSLPEFEIKTH